MGNEPEKSKQINAGVFGLFAIKQLLRNDHIMLTFLKSVIKDPDVHETIDQHLDLSSEWVDNLESYLEHEFRAMGVDVDNNRN